MPVDDAHDAGHHGLDQRPYYQDRMFRRRHGELWHGSDAEPGLDKPEGRAQVLDLVEPARPDRQAG